MTGVIDETFTTKEEGSGEIVTIDLKPGGAGITVTEGNKEEYVDLMVEYRISKRVKDQFDAVMSGFSELISQDLITVFDEREFEWLVGGISEIDVYVFSFLFSLSPIGVLRFYGRDDWAKFTEYLGYEVNDEVIQWFWKCVRSWPLEQQSHLLQFVTGTTRIPMNGFKDLPGPIGPQRFTIEKAGDPDELPKRHIPSNRIDLPPYKDYASLENKLTLAIECASLSHVLWGDKPLIAVPTERAVGFGRI
jgi:E3 ubiquitin-protein ligase NEDD4